jgi:hypothetical protein
MNYFKTPQFKALLSTVGLFLLITLGMTGFLWLVKTFGPVVFEMLFIGTFAYFMFGAYQNYLQKYKAIEDYTEDHEAKKND